jgi:hypothetical protein
VVGAVCVVGCELGRCRRGGSGGGLGGGGGGGVRLS